MNLASTLVSSCAQLLWPAHCAGCDVLLPSDDVVFCGACAHSINPLGLTCAGCAMPRLGWWDGVHLMSCAECARRDFVFSGAFAGFEYGAALAAAVVRMKHGGRPDLARRLGRILQDAMGCAIGGDLVAPAVDVVVPVPLHPRKLRQRGFNQALELARAGLARLRARASSPRTLPALERNLLLRVKNTPEMGHAGPAARRVAVFGAFGVADRARVRVKDRRFLVVDDVMTTGATLNECAETLLRAGAAEVRVVALARAV